MLAISRRRLPAGSTLQTASLAVSHLLWTLNSILLLPHQWDQLAEASGGKIDMEKYEFASLAAVSLWRETAIRYHPDPIVGMEAKILLQASIGGFIMAERGYEGPGFHYDFCSFYSAIMTSIQFHVPLKVGKFVNLEEDHVNTAEHLQYGLYKCYWSEELFGVRRQTNDRLTHFDLECLRERDVEVKMIMDGPCNELIFGEGKVGGKQLFGEYLNEMFALRQQKAEMAKSLMSTLWGAICANKPRKRYIGDEKPFDVPQ